MERGTDKYDPLTMVMGAPLRDITLDAATSPGRGPSARLRVVSMAALCVRLIGGAGAGSPRSSLVAGDRLGKRVTVGPKPSAPWALPTAACATLDREVLVAETCRHGTPGVCPGWPDIGDRSSGTCCSAGLTTGYACTGCRGLARVLVHAELAGRRRGLAAGAGVWMCSSSRWSIGMDGIRAPCQPGGAVTSRSISTSSAMLWEAPSGRCEYERRGWPSFAKFGEDAGCCENERDEGQCLSRSGAATCLSSDSLMGLGERPEREVPRARILLIHLPICSAWWEALPCATLPLPPTEMPIVCGVRVPTGERRAGERAADAGTERHGLAAALRMTMLGPRLRGESARLPPCDAAVVGWIEPTDDAEAAVDRSFPLPFEASKTFRAFSGPASADWALQ